jgi:hypothetical protein
LFQARIERTRSNGFCKKVLNADIGRSDKKKVSAGRSAHLISERERLYLVSLPRVADIKK